MQSMYGLLKLRDAIFWHRTDAERLGTTSTTARRLQRYAKISHPQTLRLTTAFVGHCGQEHVGNESVAKTSFTRIYSATHKSTAQGRLHQAPPLLHGQKGGLRSIPDE